jgi:hypothetical protein
VVMSSLKITIAIGYAQVGKADRLRSPRP